MPPGILWGSDEVAVLLGHVVGEIDESVGVTPLVIVPGDDLDELGRELDTGILIEDGGERAGDEVLRDDILIGEAEDTVEVGLGSELHLIADLLVGGTGLESNGEINDGDVGGGNSESHTSELAVKLGDDLTDGLGGTGGGRNDVAASGSACSPVLTTLGRTIDGELVHGDGVDGGHETLLDTELVVENLGDGGEAVGSAGSVGDDGHVGFVAVVVDTNDKDGGVILGRSREDDLLGTTLDMELTLLLGEENTGGLANVVGTDGTPTDLGGVSLVEDLDELAINLDATIDLLDGAGESTVDGIVLEEVGEVIDIHEGIVNGGDHSLVLVAKEGRSEDESTNTAETVDAHSNVTHCTWCVCGRKI